MRSDGEQAQTSTDAVSPVDSVEAPGELLAAWVAFLKSDLAEAINALHNRLSAIKLAATSGELGAARGQNENLERIRSEVDRASRITAGLLQRVSAGAPDSIPRIYEEYDVSRLGTARILLVESDAANRAVLAKLFERLGHTVTSVTNGLEAYEEIEQQELDCIVADLRLSYVGGRTLFEQVEEKAPQVASKFVFVTGDYMNPDSRSFLESTGQPIIGKPYELVELLGAVARVMTRHTATRNI